MNNVSLLEWIKASGPYMAAFIAAYGTYRFGIKGKLKDTDLQRTRVLNMVLSDLLIVWHYLTKLEDFAYMKHEDSVVFPLPKKFISSIALHSSLLNDGCFEDLEKSVSALKEYDPLSYYKLEGVGKRFAFLKQSFILPLLKANTNAELNKTVSNRYLTEVMKEMEEHISTISKQINRKLHQDIKKKLKRVVGEGIDELKDELFQLMYQLMTKLSPDLFPSYETFVQEMSRPELQKFLEEQFVVLDQVNISSLLDRFAENPDFSLEELLTDRSL